MNAFGLLHLTASAAPPHLTQLLPEHDNARGIVLDALFAPNAKEAVGAPGCIIRVGSLGCCRFRWVLNNGKSSIMLQKSKYSL